MGRARSLFNLLVCKVAKASDETAGLSFQIEIKFLLYHVIHFVV